MDNTVGSNIEKIKLMEKDNEIKLKQKREYETAIATINKKLKETKMAIEKYEEECAILRIKVKLLRNDLFIAKNRRDALASTVATFTEELYNLKKSSDEGAHTVWNLRTRFCGTVQNAVDEFDIRALLVKPKLSEPIHSVPKKRVEIPVKLNDRLKLAMERREKALAERNRLMLEPDNGEEFIRIRNALDYTIRKKSNTMDQ